MDKYTIVKGDNKINFVIDKIKIFYGNNYILKKQIIKYLEQSITKSAISEYFENIIGNLELLYNDEKINTNQYEIYFLKDNYDIDSDLKLGSKSLSQKYLENKLKDVEYDEMFNMIKELLKNFNIEYLEEHVNFDLKKTKVNFSIEELQLKQLIKLLDVNITSDNLIKNSFDLSYEELLEFQLKMLYEIAKQNPKTFFVVIDIPITEYIYRLITNCEISNIKFLILQNLSMQHIDVNQYILVNKKIIDLAQTEEINTFLINELPFHLEKTEIIELLNNYIKHNYNSRVIEFLKHI